MYFKFFLKLKCCPQFCMDLKKIAFEFLMNTQTGALTNPKNFDLNNNLNLIGTILDCRRYILKRN